MRYFFALLFFGFYTSKVVANFCWVASVWVKPERSSQYDLDCPFWAHYCLCDPDPTPSERRNCVAFTWEVRVVESNVPNYSIEPQEIEYSETQSLTLAEGGVHSVTVKKSNEVIETYEVGASVFGISLGATSQTTRRHEHIDQQATSHASVKSKETTITKTKIVKPGHRLVFYQIHYFLPSHDISWFFEKPQTNEEQRIGAPIIEQVRINTPSIDQVVPSCDVNHCSIHKHLHMCGSLPANKCRILNSRRQCLERDVVRLELHENYLRVCEQDVRAVENRFTHEMEQLEIKKSGRTGSSYLDQYFDQESIIDVRVAKRTAREKKFAEKNVGITHNDVGTAIQDYLQKKNEAYRISMYTSNSRKRGGDMLRR